ncbi:MAG TPA: glycosyltransferase family 9 protein, partial [Myxococcota bacterium]|nr:glycosyltransferase family 9 protein [Myxococcota bacterium]
FSSAGDLILTAPALEALRLAWPETRIVLVTHAAFAPLMTGNPHIDEIVALGRGEPFWPLRRRLRGMGVDAVVDLHGKARGLLLRYGLGARRRAAWEKRPLQQTLAVRFGGARYRAQKYIAARYHEAVERLAGERLPRRPFRYHVRPEDRAAARRLLEAEGVDLERPLVGMSPGAMWRTKRWAPERFGALAAWALGQGAQVVLSGSPGEAEVTAAVRAVAPGALDLAGKVSLGELGGLVEACTAFVANDSGPMHVARGLGVPTLAFFGSTDPGQFDFSGHALMFAGVACSPCSFHGFPECPRGHMRCLLDLDTGSAEGALSALLTRGRVPYVMG